jgi:hypothetical protein
VTTGTRVLVDESGARDGNIGYGERDELWGKGKEGKQTHVFDPFALAEQRIVGTQAARNWETLDRD